MKIAIITRHSIANYGSLLQTIATQYLIHDKLGNESIIINYVPKSESFFSSACTSLKANKKWNKNLFKKIFYLLTHWVENVFVESKFSLMRKKTLIMTRKFTNVNALSKASPDAEIYLAGSDQLWGPLLNGKLDSAYFLSFVNRGQKIVSFSSSFGRTSDTEENKEFYVASFSRFSSITVRESSAVSILKSLGFHSQLVLDPTLILDKSEWLKLSTRPIKITSPYILIYQVHNDRRIFDYAKKISKKTGLGLLQISPYLHLKRKNEVFRWLPSINDFLDYFNRASFVVTDSFHGTAFSINFNIPFVDILPMDGTETRIISLLELTGLAERIITNDDNLSLIDKPINFGRVNQTIERERKNSLNILDSIIKN
jgi:hypothetical protein